MTARTHGIAATGERTLDQRSSTGINGDSGEWSLDLGLASVTAVPDDAWQPPSLQICLSDAHAAADSDGDEDTDNDQERCLSTDDTRTPFLPQSVVTQAINRATEERGVPAKREGFVSIVESKLYLGAFRDANNPAECAAQRIGAYLCVAKECSVPAHAVAAGAPALHLPLADDASESLADHIPAAVAFIDAQAAAGRRVALFCQQGRSRSVSLAVAYVMQSQGGELRDSAAALEYVTSRYPRADPNFSFLRQLQE
uniref:protein-tyrosine-phosphatase n=1 Tax=Neobodo designis TaxID=312471 RepID=A0A7S1PS33_NEODS|mmetsp:Transcript_18098/g.56169  ORF Transcript_18098/g.56169 Transcript_18098/m.56169 type:complete len:256 (+) Transcript_18098:98-865(+)